MSHLIWTNFFFASLIFSGDGAPIPDVNNQSNAEASIINYIVEASTSAPTNDLVFHFQQALIGDNELQAASNLTHQHTSTEQQQIIFSATFHSFNSRAPPCVFS